jgi:restriction system protein
MFFSARGFIKYLLRSPKKSIFKNPDRDGSSGEHDVRVEIRVLARRHYEYQPFHDIILKTPDGTTQIDHIILSPYGIFVIETKNLSGWIFGSAHQKTWTQSLYTRTNGFFRSYSSVKYKFQNPIHQNYKHVKAIQKFLGVNIKSLFSVIVFVGDSEFKTDMPDNVLEIQELLPYLKSYTEQIISRECIEKFSQKLKNFINDAPFDESDHMRNIEHNLTDPNCPRCGKAMVLRTARRGANAGSQFWGCSGFPACKATKKYNPH